MRAPLASLLAVVILATPALAGGINSSARRANPAPAAALNASRASRLAASLANAAAHRRFGVAPFAAADAKPRLVRGQWRWQATAGYGKADLLAAVSFSRNGSDPAANVSPLVLEEW